MMWRINSIVTALYDAVFGILESSPGWLSISVLAVITGALAMVAYKYTSNQAAIGRVRDDMKSSLLALKLFKDELPVTFRSQGRLFWGAVRLFVHSLIPLAVMIVPMVLLVCQMALRYEWRPFQPGEQFLVRAILAEGTDRQLKFPSLTMTHDHVVIDKGPSRVFRRKRVVRSEPIPERNELVWSLRAKSLGRDVLRVRIGDEMMEKEVIVSDQPYKRVSPVRPDSSFVQQLLYPIEKPSSPTDTIQSVRIENYPPGKSPIFGWDVHWVITYFVVSMIAALALKPILKVKI